ncbi:hypothetical protein GGR58DRAFT_76966 [Xylaria digitata]|nr:hypothetical protein GGR58DRAFT_76966 [Xylaria digitata]
MPHHNSRHHSRSSRALARDERRARRRIEHDDNGFSAAGNEPLPGWDGIHYSQPGWSTPSWDGDATVVPHPDDSISLDPAMGVPGWQAPGTNDDRTFSSNAYYSYSPPRVSAWEDPLIAYRDNYPQDPVLPATSPIDRDSTSLSRDVYSQTGSTLSSGYREDQWTVPAPSDEASEVGSPTGQTSRRMSMRVRQGSRAELDSPSSYDDVTTSTNPEEYVRSDSSGGTTPVDQGQYGLDVCMSGEDVPWSPEFLHQDPRYPDQF